MSEKLFGYEIKDLIELIGGDDAADASKALCYLDGKQEEPLKALLSDTNKGRRGWKENGIIPRYRNITSMVVEKSGRLFNKNEPIVSVFLNGQAESDTNLTELLLQELEKTDWMEFFNNEDLTVRLLKTVHVLVQWDPVDKCLVFVLLHRANCYILLDENNKHPTLVIYKTGCSEKLETFRIITNDQYIDVISEKVSPGNHKVYITANNPNPYGIIPIATFNDTKKPRSGIWNTPGMDLVSMNEAYNLALTDSEWTISWCKKPTLFMIDCNLDGSEFDSIEVIEPYMSALPRLGPGTPSNVGGPGKAISLISSGNGNSSIQYLAPQVDIQSLDNVVNKWIESFCYDWSVRLNLASESRATSGFQVIVEELPNKELRQLRSKYFSAGFTRLFSHIKTILNTQKGFAVFPDSAMVEIEFPKLDLPTDDKSTEEVWDARINGNRASIIDYLIEEKDYSKQEAELKYQEILRYNQNLV